jgi:hypothetical protein
MYTRDFDGYILGSGFIDKRFNRTDNKWKIKIVRGPLSLEQCNPNAENVVFGDPGILANLVYSNPVKKKYNLGIVPHSSDYDLMKNKFGKHIKIINARQEPEKVAFQINQCNNIASSSLHGLIFADAFRIPNIHLKFGDNLIGGHHKFKDYYLGMDVDGYEHIDYKAILTEQDILEKCKLRFSTEELFTKQQQIINVYKETLNEILE